MKAVALLGGPKKQWPKNIKKRTTDAKNKGSLIFSSDRGSLFLLEMGIIPDVAVGDFDSLTSSELSFIESKIADIRYSHPIKDLTDSELLFETAFNDYKISNLQVYGATGGRLDHMLVNLLTFANEPLSEYCQKVEFIDIQNKIIFCAAGEHQLKFDNNYAYVGIGNLTKIKNLTIKGAKFDLQDYNSDFPRLFSSNEFLDSKIIQISFEKGIVIIIYCRDANKFDNLE